MAVARASGAIECSAVGFGVEAAAQGVDGQEEGQDGQGQGDSAGPVVLSEQAHRGGGHPVHQGGLVEEADAVDGGGDVVVTVEHLACDLQVDGVDVVQEAGREEASDLEDEPEEDDGGDRSGACL